MSEDPFRAYNFKLDILGETQGHFTEVSGLGAKIGVISYREAGSQTERKIPGFSTCASVTLRYGLTNSRTFFDWFANTAKGQIERKNVSIILLDTAGTETVAQWDLSGAWVSEWRGTLLNASDQAVAIEELVIECEELERVT